MALIEGRMSTLNPNAPLFVPAAFRQVEDFSPQWWELVKTSTWFRDYWLSEHQEDIFANDEDDVFNPWQEDVEDELTDVEAQFEDLVLWLEAEETIKSAGIPARKDVKLLNGLELNAKTLLKDLDLPKSPKGKGPRSPLGSPKYHDKPVKYVTPKCTPRKIHQIHQPR